MNSISSIQKFSTRRRVPDFQSFIIIWVFLFFLEILDFSSKNNWLCSAFCFDDVSIICKEMKTHKKVHIKLHSSSFPLFISQVMIPFTVQLYPISAPTNALFLINWSPWRFESSTAVFEVAIAARLMPEGLQIVNASSHMQPVSVLYVVFHIYFYTLMTV